VNGPRRYFAQDGAVHDIIGGEHRGWPAIRACFAHGRPRYPDLVLEPTGGLLTAAGRAGHAVDQERHPDHQRADVAEIDNGTTAAPGLLQAHLPASRVVRALSIINTAEISADGHPQGDPKRRAPALAGDDPAAKQLMAGLYDEFGFDALDIGGLDESWRIEAGQRSAPPPRGCHRRAGPGGSTLIFRC
jgi:hypothetical protein